MRENRLINALTHNPHSIFAIILPFLNQKWTMDNIDYSVIPGFENCSPRITLIVTPKTRREQKSDLNKWLAGKASMIEKTLLKNYSAERTAHLINKLRHVIGGDLSKKEGKSIGIFVSPSSEEIYYFTETNPSELKLPSVLI